MPIRKAKAIAISATILAASVAPSVADADRRFDPAPATVDNVRPCGPYFFAVRSDFNDLRPTLCPSAYDEHAQGALLSETYNALTGQNSASLDGLAAAGYQIFGVNNAATAGVFLQGDATYQFQPTSSQAVSSGTGTAGAFTQFFLQNHLLRLDDPSNDFFRIRGGETDATAGYRASTFVGEWIPWYPLSRDFAFGLQRTLGPIAYVFSPELMVQYDEFLGGYSKPAIFFADNRALRVGPEIVLQSWVQSADGLPHDLQAFVKALSTMITFHESWDTYTGRNYKWTQASVTYSFKSFDGKGSFGISASYGYGNLETSGTLASQAKLGLSFKY